MSFSHVFLLNSDVFITINHFWDVGSFDLWIYTYPSNWVCVQPHILCAYRLAYSILLWCLTSSQSSSGTFKLTLQFTEDYPNKPPTVRFVSRMFHPNSMLISFLYIYLHSVNQ
jgi:hypothetical protein